MSQLPNLSAVVEMMDRAAEAQKRAPKIELRRGDLTVVLRRAGEQSRRPGTINVTDGRPYGDNIWFGRVECDGSLFTGRDMTDEVRELLADLAADPARVAGQHGIATSRCCFCGRALSTKESRTVGYGPDCAEKYGLPWGATDAADAANKDAMVPLPEVIKVQRLAPPLGDYTEEQLLALVRLIRDEGQRRFGWQVPAR